MSSLKSLERWGTALAVLLSGAIVVASAAVKLSQETEAAERFLAVDVFVDSGKAPLAAWQVELADASGHARVVGVEGGEHAAFREAPYYDPAALQRGHIVLASFHVGTELPHGRTRVARVHFLVTGGEPALEITPVTGATLGGGRIDIRTELAR